MTNPPAPLKLLPNPGFGDSLFLYPLAEYLMACGTPIEIYSHFGAIFEPIEHDPLFSLRPYDRTAAGDDALNLNYWYWRGQKGTSHYQDMLGIAGVPLSLPFRLDFVGKDGPAGTMAARWGKPVVIVATPSNPTVWLADPQIPDFEVMQELISFLAPFCHLIQVGARTSYHHVEFPYRDIHHNAQGETCTPFTLLMKLVWGSSLVLTQCGHMMHVAAGLCRPAFVLFAQNLVDAPTKFVTGHYSRWGFDNEPLPALKARLLEALGTK